MTNYSDVLEGDLRWREAELVSLKRLAIVHNDNDIVLRATLRACWALLYAHFEGFTKFCWELLLDHVQSEGISVSQLSKDFQLLALEKLFRAIRGNSKSNSLWEFFNTSLPAELQNIAFFPTECRLETESNLWPSVFERECARIGLKSTTLESSRVRLQALVSRRNDIAHGKNMTIKSVDEYSEYEHATLLVLHDLAVQVLNAIENKAYMTTIELSRANN